MFSKELPLTEAVYYILLSLRHENHGYGIIQEVDDLTKGRVKLGPGTLYGAMQTMEKKGWITVISQDEASRKKKDYLITDLGRGIFGEETERLNELIENGKLMKGESK